MAAIIRNVVYKIYVLISAALLPWLVALAAFAWGSRARGAAIAVLLFLVYVWTDFPINYAAFGMLPYLLAIPLGLLATGVFTAFLNQGGFIRWSASAILMSLAVMVHLTAAMIVAPAAVMAYLAALATSKVGTGGDRPGERIRGLPVLRHAGVWLLPVVVLAANAFWWLPGIWLASTKGPSDFAFAHSSEGVLRRLLQIILSRPRSSRF